MLEPVYYLVIKAMGAGELTQAFADIAFEKE